MTLYIVTRPALNAADAKPPLSINGIAIPYRFDHPCELDEGAAAALRDTFGFTVTPVDDASADEPEPQGEPDGVPDPETTSPASGDGDGAASSDGGATDGGADTGFDPEQVIEGTVAEVTAKLAALTPEQLEAVRAAEIDREKPRVGVTKAIDDAIAATKE